MRQPLGRIRGILSLDGQQNRPVAAGGGLTFDVPDSLGYFERPLRPHLGRRAVATWAFRLAQDVDRLHLPLFVVGKMMSQPGLFRCQLHVVF